MKIIIKVLLLIFIFNLPVFGKETLSVLYFSNTTSDKKFNWLCRGIADVLSTDLAQSTKINIVERENLEKIMKEQELQLAGVTSTKNAVKIGELLQAQKLIYGSFIVRNHSLRIDARLSDVSSGKIEKSFSIMGESADVLNLIEKLSQQVRQKMGLEKSTSIPLLKPRAVKNYYQGLDLLDKGYYKRAHAIRKRLDEKPFRSNKNIMKGINQENINLNMFYTQGGSREELVCQLSSAYSSIATHSEDINDHKMARRVLKEAVKISDYWFPKMKSKHFQRQLLYQKISLLESLHDWVGLKKAAEEFMMKYPNYFMIEAVEDSYQTALDAIKVESKRKK